jgi:hypothetical protein
LELLEYREQHVGRNTACNHCISHGNLSSRHGEGRQGSDRGAAEQGSCCGNGTARRGRPDCRLRPACRVPRWKRDILPQPNHQNQFAYSSLEYTTSSSWRISLQPIRVLPAHDCWSRGLACFTLVQQRRCSMHTIPRPSRPKHRPGHTHAHTKQSLLSNLHSHRDLHLGVTSIWLYLNMGLLKGSPQTPPA